MTEKKLRRSIKTKLAHFRLYAMATGMKVISAPMNQSHFVIETLPNYTFPLRYRANFVSEGCCPTAGGYRASSSGPALLGSMGLPFSSILPKIILPLAVCSTLVTEISTAPADHLARVIHHHHGAVVQVADALVVLLAFFQDEHIHAARRAAPPA